MRQSLGSLFYYSLLMFKTGSILLWCQSLGRGGGRDALIGEGDEYFWKV